MKKQIVTGLILLTVLLVALLTRLGAVVVPLKDFDSDEAVVGLMARDILAGESWPVFYAGQSYLGALEPWSVAASFAILGESAFSLRLVPLAMLVARALAESRALLDAGGWSINSLILLRPLRGRSRAVFLALAGIGLLVLAFAAPMILINDETLEGWTGGSLADGAVVARSAVIYFALLYLAELAVLSRSRPGGFVGFLKRSWEASAGLRMLLAMAALCLLLAVLLLRRRRDLGLADDGSSRPIRPLALFGGTTLATLLLVVTSSYARDASAARYLLPLLLSLPATLYLLLEWGSTSRTRLTGSAGTEARVEIATSRGRRILRCALLLLLTATLAAGNLWGQASLLSPRSSGSPYPGLVDELDSRGGEAFIADYWTAYPLAFLAASKFDVAPADGADRFPAVSSQVRSEGPEAYLFAEGSAPLAEFRVWSLAGELQEEVVRPVAGGPRYHLFYLAR